jgi:hypothetical protein
LLITWPGRGFAQTDEIQVYDAEIAEPGALNLEVHNNYTFDGLKMPRFPGGLVPNHTLNGVPEWTQHWLDSSGQKVAVIQVLQPIYPQYLPGGSRRSPNIGQDRSI